MKLPQWQGAGGNGCFHRLTTKPHLQVKFLAFTLFVPVFFFFQPDCLANSLMQNFSTLQFSKLGLVVKFDCPTKTLIRAFPCTRPNAPREPQDLTNLLMVNSLFHYLTVCLAHE